MEAVFLLSKKLKFFVGFDFEGENVNAADNLNVLDKNPSEYLTSRDLAFSTKSNQHSTFFHWLSNRKCFAFESAIKLFLLLERPRKKLIINKFGDGTHLT